MNMITLIIILWVKMTTTILILIADNENVDAIEVQPALAEHNINRNIIGQSWVNVDEVNI